MMGQIIVGSRWVVSGLVVQGKEWLACLRLYIGTFLYLFHECELLD
jgi:hypothetical protein